MRQYIQLTDDNHTEIYAMKQAAYSQAAIAPKPRVHPGTVRDGHQRWVTSRVYYRSRGRDAEVHGLGACSEQVIIQCS